MLHRVMVRGTTRNLILMTMSTFHSRPQCDLSINDSKNDNIIQEETQTDLYTDSWYIGVKNMDMEQYFKSCVILCLLLFL